MEARGTGSISEELIREAGRRLARAAGPGARVILFGSHARGSADDRSDLDFLVVEAEVDDRHAEMLRLRRALRPLVVPADVLVYSEREVEQWRGVPNTVINAALREGRVVHG